MTYRELLKLYKQGKLEDSTKKQIEAEIEKQDAISEFLYEEGAIPDFSDLESGQDYFDDLNDKKQWTERQNSKTEDNVEKQSENRIIEKSKSAGDSRNQQEDEFNRQFIKEIQRSIRKAFIKMGMVVGAGCPCSCPVCSFYSYLKLCQNFITIRMKLQENMKK